MLLTTLVLLHNIQISKLSVKKGNYLLDFCKGGNERIQTCSLFSDIHMLFGDKGVKLSESYLVERWALDSIPAMCIAFRFVAGYYCVFKAWSISTVINA